MKQAGFTLIELMIAVVIVAILAAIAVPSYQNYILKSQRAVGTAQLQKLASIQESFFLNNRQYAATLDLVGFAAATVGVDREGAEVAAGAGIYDISVSAATAISYTVQAVPKNNQADDDTCGTLTLSNLEVRTESGTGSLSECW